MNQSPCLFFNGALLLWVTNSFCLNDEIFRKITLPPQNYHTLEQLAVFKGSLALIRFGDALCHI